MKKLLFLYLLLHLHGVNADWQTIFAHGIIDGPSQMDRFAEAISTPKSTVEFADAGSVMDWSINRCIASTCATLLKIHVNRAKMFMGQGNDIARLGQKLTENQHDQIILYGCSRGASTIINTLAQQNPPNIAALVLDATPANMPATIIPVLAKFGIHPSYAPTIFQMLFPAYPKDSQPPIHAIKNIANKKLPILLIHSATDQKVPVQHSCQLYQEFKNQGFENVELIVLPEGRHSYILQDEKLKTLYLQAVHSFYKKYQLPYDSAWTQQEFDWKKQYPSNLQNFMTSYEKNIEQTYQKTRKTSAAALALIMLCLGVEFLA